MKRYFNLTNIGAMECAMYETSLWLSSTIKKNPLCRGKKDLLSQLVLL
jgi:hypothetical protein